jgi:hypothetical protein
MTKAALAIKRSQGVVLGRPRTLPDKVVDRILRERAKGRTWTAIADGLNGDGVPTAQGGRRWYPATGRSVAQVAELKGVGTVVGDYLGGSVGVSGTTAVVGAFRHAHSAGLAIVFEA